VEIRPWKPADHTNTGSGGSQAPAKGSARQVTGEPTTTVEGLDAVSLATWRANCVTCHGPLGRGDGPQAAMFKPKDLSEPAWQASVSDEQVYEVIQNGRNRMPGFALPETVARNLVKLIRLLDDTRPKAPSGAASSGSTVAGTTATAGGIPPGQAPPSRAAAPAAPAPSPSTAAPSMRPRAVGPVPARGGGTAGSPSKL
jgi:mono/diheme cytochrome c family protein